MNQFPLSFSLLLDPLSVIFLAVIGIVSIPSAIFSAGYLQGAYTRNKIVFGGVLFCAFVLSMAAVVVARNLIVFLIAWEVMSLLSYFFVVFDEHERSVKAGTIYIVMTHIGTAFIIAAFLILYAYTGSFDILAVKQACVTLPPDKKNITFLLLLVGFGTKAGIVPLHLWLPYAHPQAPSHVSSVMSGVMIKTAIYGILRFVIFTLGVGEWWWGNLVLILGSISCLAGVMYALMEHDIKKLLAYHSVENIGIILLGVGASMMFVKLHMQSLAVLAMIAGIYHLINHAIFKSLLFLCSGSVYKATGLRNIEKLGGLIKTMPFTAAAFLAGAMAISAIPPLNGFISEWLTLQSLFLGALHAGSSVKVLLSLYAAALALTGGLAAACFVKAFGVTFLAMPRSEKAKEAQEVPWSMRFPMLFMALLTIVFGLGAAPVITFLTRAAAFVIGVDPYGMSFTLNNFTLMPQYSTGIFLSSPLIAAVIALTVLVATVTLYFIYGQSKVTRDRTWGCGYYNLDHRTEYTSTGFSKPFRIAFSFFLRPYRKTEMIKDTSYFVKSYKYEVYTTSIFKEYLYKSTLRLVLKIAKTLRRIQPGSIHLYLAYIFVTILALIIFLNR